MIQLYPFQETLIDRLRSSIRRGNKSPLVVSPCGSGKTIMFAWLAGKLIESGYRTDILNHRYELSDQISLALGEFNIRHGIIKAGKMEYDLGSLIHVSSAFTVVRRLGKLAIPRYLFIDEGHHAVEGNTWSKIIQHWRRLNPDLIVVGWTGTPERLGGEGLNTTYDDMIVGPTVRQLIDEKYLSDYRLFAPPVQQKIDFSRVHHRGGDWVKSEVTEIMDKPRIYGNAISHYRELLNGAPTIVFTASVQHAHNAADQFKSYGYRAVALDGKMKSKDRRHAIRDFSAGRLNTIMSCDLISEGLDVPGAMGMIGLRPTESLALCMQQWGRVLRAAPGKEFAFILDHVNNWARHGLPDSEREWSLEGHAGKKAKRDPQDISIRQCGKCGAVQRVHTTVCQDCGCIFPIKKRVLEEVEGTLTEVDRSLAKFKFIKARNHAKDKETLVALGRMRGMQNPVRWAEHVLAARNRKKRRYSGWRKQTNLL